MESPGTLRRWRGSGAKCTGAGTSGSEGVVGVGGCHGNDSREYSSPILYRRCGSCTVCTVEQRDHCSRSRVPESGTPGSAGAAGGQLPAATRPLRAGKTLWWSCTYWITAIFWSPGCRHGVTRGDADARSTRGRSRHETPVHRPQMRRRGVPEGQFGPWSNPANKPCDDPFVSGKPDLEPSLDSRQ